MSRIGWALRAFFRVLSGSVPVEQVQALLVGTAPFTSQEEPRTESAEPAPPPQRVRRQEKRSDAITLLAALQREARLVDLVQEPLNDYNDAQIGAAARDVLRDCREVLARMFALQPIMNASENTTVETPADLNANRWRVSGNVTGDPPFRGQLVHHGWEATRCDLPDWSGDEQSVLVVAPVEIES